MNSLLKPRKKIISVKASLTRNYTSKRIAEKIEKIRETDLPLSYDLFLSSKDLESGQGIRNTLGKFESELTKSQNVKLIPKVILSSPLPLTTSKRSENRKGKERNALFKEYKAVMHPFDDADAIRGIKEFGDIIRRKRDPNLSVVYRALFYRFVFGNEYEDVLVNEREREGFIRSYLFFPICDLLENTVKTKISINSHPTIKLCLDLFNNAIVRRIPDLVLKCENKASVIVETKIYLSLEEDDLQSIPGNNYFKQTVEYMIILKSSHAIINNAYRTICVELEDSPSLSGSTEDATLVFKCKVLNYNDKIITKLGFILWWLLRICRLSREEVEKKQQNIEKLRERLILSEEAQRTDYHNSAKEFLDQNDLDGKILKINVCELSKIFKVQKEVLSDDCQVLDINQEDFKKHFSYESKVPDGKVRLFIYDPIRAYYYSDYEDDEMEASDLRYYYLQQLEALTQVKKLQQTTDPEVNGVQVLKHGFFTLSEKFQHMFIGYYIAVSISNENIDIKRAKKQMETLHRNGFSSISSNSLDVSELAMNDGNVCFLRPFKLRTSHNSKLFKSEQEALSKYSKFK